MAVVIDRFEQAVQLPRDYDSADALYSGQKKRHTLKGQMVVNEESGEFVDVSESVRGPTADLTYSFTRNG